MDKKKLCDINFYKECENKVLENLCKIKGVISIYKFGSVKAPGNSDLDFLLIVEKDKRINEKIYEFLDSLSEEEKYIAYQHSPMILPRELSRKLHKIRKATDLIHLYGETIEFEEMTEVEELNQFLELLVQDYPNRFEYIKNELRKREVRIGYQFINAIKYTVSIIKNIDIKCTEDLNRMLDQMILNLEENDSMRKRMFELSFEKQEIFILKTIDFMEKLIYEIKKELDRYLKNKYLIKNLQTVRKGMYIYKETLSFEEARRLEDITIDLKLKKYCSKQTFQYASFSWFFKNEKLIEKRKEILKEYLDYIDIYNLKRSLYYPKSIYYSGKKMYIYNFIKNIYDSGS